MNTEQKTNDRRLLDAVIESASTWGRILAECEKAGDADRFLRTQLEAARFFACLPLTLEELLQTDYADCDKSDLAMWVCEQTLNKITACRAMTAMEQGK